MNLRDFTQDMVVFEEVYCQNEYNLPEKFEPWDVILDIGAHIGCFALACLKRGCKHIVCYEPDPDNFYMLRMNLACYEDAVIHRAAVWRSDGEQPVIHLARAQNRAYTAVSQVQPGPKPGGFTVKAVPLDEILVKLGKVTLLKIDCEGSEYPILYTSKELGRVQEIKGEAHEKITWQGCPRECSSGGVVKYLREQGFEAGGVPHPRSPEFINFFFGKRKVEIAA